MSTRLKIFKIGSCIGAGLACVGLGYFAYRFKPIVVVWDLDKTLICSTRASDNDKKSQEKQKYVKQQVLCIKKDHFEHVDDDLIHFRTYFRPYSRFVLRCLSVFCKQYCFTSATEGYMENILEALDPKKKIFSKPYLSRSKKLTVKILRKRGKDLRLLIPENELNLKKTVLIDDQIAYHKSMPENGLLCVGFRNLNEENNYMKDDKEILKIFIFVLYACFCDDVRVVLKDVNEEKYFEYFDMINPMNVGD